MKISLGQGFDSILFGNSEAKITKLLGKPDKAYEADYERRTLQYNELQIELTFEPENDSLLGWIEVYNPKAELFGKKIIGLRKKEVLDFISKHIDEKPEIEDYGSFISVSFDNHWLELQFRFDRLENLNFGVLYDNSDTPIWPTT